MDEYVAAEIRAFMEEFISLMKGLAVSLEKTERHLSGSKPTQMNQDVSQEESQEDTECTKWMWVSSQEAERLHEKRQG